MRPHLEALACALALVSCGLPPEPLERPTIRRDELRPDTPNTTELPPTYSSSETVERYAVPDASVVVHFTRAGPNAVSATDQNGSGIPDFVESVGATYRSVIGRYHDDWGFRAPPNDQLVPVDNGGDSRFDTYLLDFALRADGAFRRECVSASGPCTGYMTQENDFTGYGYPSVAEGIRVVSSHEYFHAVQAGYGRSLSVNVSEGTAVWATERFDPALFDLEAFSGGYLSLPERSLDQEPTGPVDGYSYGSAVFWECLAASRGDDVVREFLERFDGSRPWLAVLQTLLAEDGGSLSAELERCFEWNLYTGARARAGYGHRRANQLAEAPVVSNELFLRVSRARMFRTSSRYWRITKLENAFFGWKTADDAPDGGADFMSVRAAQVTPNAPSFQRVKAGEVVPVSGAEVLVLASNLQIGSATTPSIPIAVCVGPIDLVRDCLGLAADAGASAPDAGQTLDAGQVDAGQTRDAGVDPEPEPTGCGCSKVPGLWGVLSWSALLLLRRRHFSALSCAKSF